MNQNNILSGFEFKVSTILLSQDYAVYIILHPSLMKCKITSHFSCSSGHFCFSCYHFRTSFHIKFVPILFYYDDVAIIFLKNIV